MTSNGRRKVSNVVRWTLLVLGLGFSLVYLNSSLFCFWVAGGPPNDYPQAYFHQGVRMFCFSAAIFVSAVGLFFGLGALRRRRKLVVACVGLLLIGTALAYPSIREFLLVDECLDLGGAWHEPYFHCDHDKGCPVIEATP